MQLMLRRPNARKGIDAAGHQNIKLYNGTVRGMGSAGILASYGAIIESVRVASNDDGISVLNGTVSGNTEPLFVTIFAFPFQQLKKNPRTLPY